jgi:DNA-binding NarL/FixJ family response regulator
MRKIEVLIVDDHTVVRDSICSLLALAGDKEVVGEAANERAKGCEQITARCRTDRYSHNHYG